MEKRTIPVKGMHCKSCELLIEDNLKRINGIIKVKASFKTSSVEITTEDDVIETEILEVIKKSGYEIGKSSLPLFSINFADYKDVLIAGILLASVYLFAVSFGFGKNFIPSSTNSANLLIIFSLGITAGFSTCMAIIGGLILGVSARFARKHPDSTATQKFRPHLFFNLGRIGSYFLLGGAIGQLGSVFQFSSSVLGILTIVVALVMIYLGLSLTNLFPRLSSGPTLPKNISRLLRLKEKEEREYSHLNSVILGAGTFFLPCGFTQALQVYAISTGGFVTGSLIMGVFALGTTPGLLGVGGLVSVLKEGYFSRLFFKFIGLVVIVLAVYNLTIGVNLTGINIKVPDTKNAEEQKESPVVTDSAGFQVMKAEYTAADAGKIRPNKFTINSGQPARLEILAKDDGAGCMGSILIPGLFSQPQYFVKGETVVMEFLPKNPGTYQITCAMGIQADEITVR